MKIKNIEIKATYDDHDNARIILKSENADFKYIDFQVDTYFVVKNGRLKLRESQIENSLIYYNREDKRDPKKSNAIICKNPDFLLKNSLINSLEILIRIEKKREIYIFNNVKIHLDEVKDLGCFIEVEAMGKDDDPEDYLLNKCNYFIDLLNIKKENFVSESYSDLLIKKSIQK